MDLERDRRTKPTPETCIFQFLGDTLTDLLYDQEEIQIPDHCRAIGTCAFTDNLFLEHVTLPSSVKSIGCSAFLGCMYLTSIQFSEGLETIGSGAFQDTGLRTLSFPATLREIGDEAFTGCPLEELTLPEGLITVGAQAFSECTDLKSVTISDSLEDLAEDAFFLCPNLRHIRASPHWQQTHPQQCLSFCHLLQENFLQQASCFIRAGSIRIPPELEAAIAGLDYIHSLQDLQDAMDTIAARLRAMDPAPPRVKILRNAVCCRLCGDIIESKSRHGCVTCRCGACTVDGGRDYLRRIGKDSDYTELSEVISIFRPFFS